MDLVHCWTWSNNGPGWTKDQDSSSTMGISGEANRDKWAPQTLYCSVFGIKKATENFDELKVEE